MTPTPDQIKAARKSDRNKIKRGAVAKPKRGAPLLFAAPMRSVLVKLDPASIARAKKLGDGNVSAGIRKALAA